MTEKEINSKDTILYIEDDPTYCFDLNKALEVHEELAGRIEIVQGRCVEEAFSILKSRKIKGILLDLHILQCKDKALASCGEEKLALRDYAPDNYLGIGLMLYMQRNHEFIKTIPKMVITGYSFESYKDFYEKMAGPKEFEMKLPDWIDNSSIIIHWLKKICN